jgi:hypothetical protein
VSTIGIICEAGLGSEDEQVLRHLAGRIRPDATPMIRPLGRKPDLIVQCGQVAQALFDSGCERVLVIWDVFPRWGRPDGEAQDIADIQAILTQAGLANHPCLFLVAIQAELEAWLLADGSALSATLSRPTHPVTVGHSRNIEHNTNPKKRLESIFGQHGRTYTPKTDALAIIRQVPANFGMLGKLRAFKKLGRSLTQVC